MSYVGRLLIVSIVSSVMAGFGVPATAQDTISYSVLNIKKRMNYMLGVGMDVVENGKTVFKSDTQVTITIGANDTPATLATQIVQKIGNNAMLDPNNNTNVIVPATKTITAFAANPGAVDIVKTAVDSRSVLGSLPLSNTTPIAKLSFGPNPDNGQDTLVTATDITLGFASGLPPVSFTAPMDISITSLTSLVNSELGIGGYLTMPDLTDIIIFAQGASSGVAPEIDYIFDPLADVGDQGILTILSVVVPEPGSIGLLGASLAFLGILILQRRRSSQSV